MQFTVTFLFNAKTTQIFTFTVAVCYKQTTFLYITRMWANAQPDGRPAEHRWRPLFNAANSG